MALPVNVQFYISRYRKTHSPWDNATLVFIVSVIKNVSQENVPTRELLTDFHSNILHIHKRSQVIWISILLPIFNSLFRLSLVRFRSSLPSMSFALKSPTSSAKPCAQSQAETSSSDQFSAVLISESLSIAFPLERKIKVNKTMKNRKPNPTCKNYGSNESFLNALTIPHPLTSDKSNTH